MKNLALAALILSTLVAKLSYGCAGLIGAFHEGAFTPVTISRTSPAYLADHRVVGKVVVSAASFLDAALSAARLARSSKSVQVSSVTVRRPLILETGDAKQVITSVKGDRIRISTGETDCHLTASIDEAVGQPLPVIPAPQSRLYKSSGLYTALAGGGLDYGPLFKTLTNFSVNTEARTVVGDLQLSAEWGEHTVHPTLIDGAFHALASIQFMLNSGDLGEGLYVPVFFGTVRYTPGQIETNRYFVYGKIVSADKGAITYHLYIEDMYGFRVLEIESGRMQAITRGSL